ncbi:uncharacterized protein L203_102584 [Cryptococcus depauperatus CBS 7841]|uniref:Uncharacterized protein n=1 Tax=Cryptococcus depauperatus CBS 7841 TaxID=1295531 RepID=A0AAJ8M0G9_9TREE
MPTLGKNDPVWSTASRCCLYLDQRDRSDNTRLSPSTRQEYVLDSHREKEGEARGNGVALYFEGGPGVRRMDYPFLDAGPRELTLDNGTAEKPKDSFFTVAEDCDDVLQAVWRDLSKFTDQSLTIQCFLEARRRLPLLQLCRSGTKSPGRLTGGSRRVLTVLSWVTRSCLSCKYSERSYLCNTTPLVFPPYPMIPCAKDYRYALITFVALPHPLPLIFLLVFSDSMLGITACYPRDNVGGSTP